MDTELPHRRADRAQERFSWLSSLALHTGAVLLLAVATPALVTHSLRIDGATLLSLGEEADQAELASDAATLAAAPDATSAEFTVLTADADGLPSPAPAPAARQLRWDLVGGSPAAGAATDPGDAGRAAVGAALAALERRARLSLFGAEAEGTKFVFVFDRSTSMAGAPLAAAKQQLTACLEALGSLHQFQVIFFNHQVQAWDHTGGQQRVPFATEANKELARRFVASVTAEGGTDRRAALLRALALAPDAIFFLTDADDAMPAYDVAEALERAARSRTTIACIEFGVGPATRSETFLTQLAHGSGGDYVYVDVTQLGRTP